MSSYSGCQKNVPIFSRFYTKKVMGKSRTGLGMAVVWGTVKDHKGYIDVDSQEGKRPDLLVLDMIMDPGIDGLETYKRVLNICPHQKAVIASGFAENDRVKQTQKLGAGQYIKKPYTIEKIGLAVKNELKQIRTGAAKMQAAP
jgi:DNA-binding NarL/FixJ family response regulator